MAESKTNEGMIQLTDILDEISPHDTWPTEESKSNYMHDMRERLIEVFDALGLRNQMDCFKRDAVSNSPYVFYESEVPFIKQLYADFSKELSKVRKKTFKKISDSYAVYLYENIRDLFLRRGFSDKEAYERTSVTCSLLDYPLRVQNMQIERIGAALRKIMGEINEVRMTNVTSKNDDLVWMRYVAEDIDRQVEKYIDLYSCMRELRQMDINDYTEKEFNSLTQEEQEQLELEQDLAMRAYHIYKAMPEVKSLEEQSREITGMPLSCRERMYWVERDDYTLAEQRKLDKIKKRLQELSEAAKDIARKQAQAEGLLLKPFEKNIDYSINGLMTSEELLRKSIETLAEEEEDRARVGVNFDYQ